jgi:hypothetical protein
VAFSGLEPGEWINPAGRTAAASALSDGPRLATWPPVHYLTTCTLRVQLVSVNERDAANDTLDAALLALRRGAGLTAIATREARSAGSPVDALVKVQTDQGDRLFAAEIKVVDRFQTPAQVLDQLAHRKELPLLVAPFISRKTAEHCRSLHLSFIDTAGNAYLDAPGLYVYITGQPRPKSAGESRFRAVGAAGLQVTFALLSRPTLVAAPYREIARAAGTALGSITHAMRDLEARALLAGDPLRRLLDPGRLLEEWVTYYPISLRAKLNPRRFEAEPEILAKADLVALRAYWGGERAAERLTGLLDRKSVV